MEWPHTCLVFYECFHIWGAFTESCLALLLAHARLLAYAFNFLPFDHIANGQLFPFSTFNGTRFNLQHACWRGSYGQTLPSSLGQEFIHIWIIYFSSKYWKGRLNFDVTTQTYLYLLERRVHFSIVGFRGRKTRTSLTCDACTMQQKDHI